MAPLTFSRTSSDASVMLRSSTKVTVILAVPSVTRAWIASMPLTEAMASSSGITTCEVTSSGEAPGSSTLTLTVAGSLRGNRSTPSWVNEDTPSTTRNITNMKAKTGRSTQISDRRMGTIQIVTSRKSWLQLDVETQYGYYRTHYGCDGTSTLRCNATVR